MMRRLNLFPHREIERDIDEELEYHLESRIRDHIAAGMTPSEAREEAERRFGDANAVRRACQRIGMERVRAQRRAEMIDQLRQDGSYALRTLTKRPGFVAVAVLTLALGIGGTTALFSVVDGVLLRPLAFPDPERLALLWGVESGMKSGSSATSYPDYVDIKAGQKSFEAMATWSNWQLTVTGTDLEPTRVPASWISRDLLPLLGVSPILGRNFLPEEDRVGGEPVVILAHGFWTSRFASGPNVIGRTVMLDGRAHTVVGVLPSGFNWGTSGGSQLFLPSEPIHSERSRGQHNLLVIGRLKPGVTLEAAEADVITIAAYLEEAYPEWNTGRSAELQPLREAVVGNVRPALLMLFGAVVLVLLIVCANVANLTLARATGRANEVAIRTALGAGRSRLVRQLLTESLLLALFGGAVGILIARGGIGLLKSIGPASVPRLSGVAIDMRVAVFALAVTALTGVLFGLVPALQSSKTDLQTSLKEGGRTSSQGGGRPRLRQLLVVSEMALAVVLVVGAALFVNSFLRLQRVDAGFTQENVLIAPIALPESKYPFEDWRRGVAFFDALIERVEALPGVESAALGYRHPLDGGWETSFQIRGLLELPQGERPEARIRPVTPGYFETVGIPILKGRAFTDRDMVDAPGVVIVNDAFAKTFLPDEDPIGHRLIKGAWWPERPGEWEIVGVVGDVKMDGLAQTTPWAMYFPYGQWPFNDMNLIVRASGESLALTGSIRQQVWSLDGDVPVETFQTLRQIRTRSVAPQRFQTMLLGLFAALALGLAAVGIYGVLSYTVTQRTAEIGVRMSLGADTGDILRIVVAQGMKLSLLGLLLGLAGALAATRLIAGLIFGVSPTDPGTFAAVAGLLFLTGLGACALPALRASRVDPVIALRTE
jgi:predicted permease